jgi:hypothetical protein
MRRSVTDKASGAPAAGELLNVRNSHSVPGPAETRALREREEEGRARDGKTNITARKRAGEQRQKKGGLITLAAVVWPMGEP